MAKIAFQNSFIRTAFQIRPKSNQPLLVTRSPIFPKIFIEIQTRTGGVLGAVPSAAV